MTESMVNGNYVTRFVCCLSAGKTHFQRHKGNVTFSVISLAFLYFNPPSLRSLEYLKGAKIKFRSPSFKELENKGLS